MTFDTGWRSTSPCFGSKFSFLGPSPVFHGLTARSVNLCDVNLCCCCVGVISANQVEASDGFFCSRSKGEKLKRSPLFRSGRTLAGFVFPLQWKPFATANVFFCSKMSLIMRAIVFSHRPQRSCDFSGHVDISILVSVGISCHLHQILMLALLSLL